MKIAIAGGTGFVGKALRASLEAAGRAVTVLPRATDGWKAALEGADAAVNLAGENIAAGRWTPQRKLALTKSRVDSTRAMVAAISQCDARPKVLLNASAVGFYGGAPAGPVDERSPQGRDFLAALCGQWEREAYAAEPLGVRVVTARLGVVLGRGGGALAKMLPPFKAFVGGPLGSGRQPMPWVHMDDVVGAIEFAIAEPKLSGPVNVVTAAPSNAEFSRALGRALGRPALLPAPAFALRLLLGEMSDMLLGGQDARNEKLRTAGYRFRRPELDDALRASV